MALDYKKLHDSVSKKELNGINSILRAVTEYKDSITLNSVSEYGLFTVTDDTLFVSGGMPTATYTINNDLIMVINEDGDGELPLTERLDSKLDLKVTFPPYYTYKVNPYILTLVADHTSITLGETVTITATLLNDGVPVENEYVQLFEDGSNIQNNYTDNTGMVSFTVQNLTGGSHSFYCTCDLTDESNIVVVSVVEPVYDLVLSCSTPIIQTGDNASVTALLTRDGVAYSGETLTYTVKHGATTIDSGTVTTGSDGTASISYTGTGVGDVSVEVSYRTLLQKTFVVEDCLYWNDGSTVTGLLIDSNVSCTSNGEYITITTSTSGEKYVKLPNTLTSSDNWEYSVEIAEIGNNQSLAVNLINSNIWAGHGDLQDNWFLHSTNVLIRPETVGDVARFTKNGNNITMTVNNDMGSNTQSFSFPTSYWVGFYTNNGRVQKVKNIKLKAL